MNAPRRRLFSALAILASMSTGCGPDHDRLDVYTARRAPGDRVRPKDRGRLKPKPGVVRAPIVTPLPPTNGVDVPIIEPE